MRVSANLFELLGVEAVAGRLLQAEDDDPARKPVTVLIYESWQRRFAADPQIAGKVLNLNGESYTIVGVLPANFSLPEREAERVIPLRS